MSNAITNPTYGHSVYRGRKRASPTSIAIVIALHGAGLGALMLAKPDLIQPYVDEPPEVFNVPTLTDPPPLPEDPPETVVETPPREITQTRVPVERTRVESPPELPELTTDYRPPVVDPLPPIPPTPPVPAREPVLTDARFARSAMANLQPRYPSSMIRAGVEGQVTVRVRIAANGRVTDVRRVSAVHDALFEATRRHALRSWRFEPATRDGRPVESWQRHTVSFRIT